MEMTSARQKHTLTIPPTGGAQNLRRQRIQPHPGFCRKTHGNWGAPTNQLGRRTDQINFIDYEDTRRTNRQTIDQRRIDDLGLWSRSVRYPQNDIRLRYCLMTARNSDLLNRILRLTQARRINDMQRNALYTDRFPDCITGRSGNVSHDGTLGSGQPV